MNLRTLSHEEFLRLAHGQINELTSTEFEVEALRRLDAVDVQMIKAVQEANFTAIELVDLSEAMGELHFQNTIKLLNKISDSNVDTGVLMQFIDLMDKSGITEPDELQDALELAQKFRTIANDVGDAFTRLTTLVNETQE